MTNLIDTTSHGTLDQLAEARPRRRPMWPLFGVAAGVTGLATSLLAIPSGLDEDAYLSGPAILDELDRGQFHVAFVLGLISVATLLVTAAAWRRWAAERAPDDLAARTIGGALTATATVNITGTALCGSMALYMPGGTDENWLSTDAQFINFTLLDFGTLFGWWGAIVAAISVAVLAFGRERRLPRWMGVVSTLLVLPPIGLAVAIGLPGLPGFFMPVWLVVVSLGLVFGRADGA